MDKKQLGKLVARCFEHFGASKTAVVIDDVKNLGYHYACIAGMTVAISDIIVPEEKKDILASTEKQVNGIERQFSRGLITDDERYKKVIELWTKATDDVTDAMTGYDIVYFAGINDLGYPGQELFLKGSFDCIDKCDFLIKDEIGVIGRAAPCLIPMETAHGPVNGTDPIDSRLDFNCLHRTTTFRKENSKFAGLIPDRPPWRPRSRLR